METAKAEILILDLDGTLADTLPDITAAIIHTMEELGLAPPSADFVRYNLGGGAGLLMKRLLDGSAPGLVDTATDRFVEYYTAHAAEQTTLYPGVADTLAWFQGQKRLAVATAKARPATLAILEHFNILRCFDMVVTMSDMPRPKPDPCSIQMILERFGEAPENALMVGDSLTDIRTAQNAGVPSCAVGYGYGLEGLRQEGGYDWFIHSFDGLKTLF